MNDESPGVALVMSATRSSHAKELAAQYGELAIDAVFASGAFKDIPVIGSIVGLSKTGTDIKTYIFMKKLARFLVETEQMSQDQRDDFYQKMSASEAEILGETTLSILDKCDSDVQAGMLGRAFVRLMEGAIPRDTFELYAFAIRDINRYHVTQIKQAYAIPEFMVIDAVAAVYLSMHGLMNVVTSTRITNGPIMEKTYEKTAFGQGFYDNLIK